MARAWAVLSDDGDDDDDDVRGDIIAISPVTLFKWSFNVSKRHFSLGV